MPKVSIKVGFAISSEILENGRHTGVWEETIVERLFYPEVLKSYHNVTIPTDSVIAEPRISDKLSIVCDQFLMANLGCIKYVTYMGSRWAVSAIESGYPRIILSIGGLYHGPGPEGG